jgi:tetratricopeptide (TPR) repeat protein
MRKAAAFVVFLILFLSGPGRSQAADAVPSPVAEELVRLLYEGQDLSGIVDTIMAAKTQDNPQLQPYRGVMLAWLKKNLSWDSLGPSMVRLYASQFSEAELRDLIAFYKTPTGRKLLARSPSMTAEMIRISFNLVEERQGELEELMNAAIWKDAGEALLQRANALYDQEKWQEARNAYTRYLEVHPDEIAVRTDLGSCYQGLGDPQSALREIDRALSIDPNYWQALYNKIIILGFDLDRKPEARQLLMKLQALQPGNEDVKKLAAALDKE